MTVHRSVGWLGSKWLPRHKRFHFHFTPTYGSWMNLVERWFSALTTKKLQRSAHDLVAALAADIVEWVEHWNEDPKAFVWHKTADETLERLGRYCAAVTTLNSMAKQPDRTLAVGRERLEFIDGDVPLPPYPEWARSDEALASVALLMRGMHGASTAIDLTAGPWSEEMADPHGGPVLCHNDVCLENVVFRNGRAIALLDFDFAAPGRRVFDVASFARMCVPVDDETNASRLGWPAQDLPSRLRLVADAYGLEAVDRLDLLEILGRAIETGGEFVRRRVEAGAPGFVKMWEEMGGAERFDRRRRWWSGERPNFEAAIQQ